MAQYFVKRGAKTMGPLTASKIGELIKARKLKGTDDVSLCQDGPWTFLSESRKAIMDGTYGVSEVSESNVTKCDDCGGVVSLKAATCPHCGCPCDGQDDQSEMLYSDDDYGMPTPRKKKPSKKKVRGNSKKEAQETKPRSKGRIALFCVLGWLLIAGGYSLYEKGFFKSQQQLKYEQSLQEYEDTKDTYERGLKDSDPDRYRQYQADQIRNSEFEKTK